MIGPHDLQGCIPAVATPVKGFGVKPPIDFEHYERHLIFLLESGITKFVLAATTGMGSLLSEEEHIEVVAYGTELIRGWCRERRITPIIIAAAGSNSASEAINRTIAIVEAVQVEGVLHTAGYYVGGTSTGIRAQFREIADTAIEFDTAVILYNVPSRTTVDFGVDLPVSLSSHPAIIGIKEAGGSLEQVAAILQRTERNSFAVLSGEDHQVAAIIEKGGIGAISASANIWPREFLRLTDLALKGEFEKAAELQKALLPCVNAVFPPGVRSPHTIQHMLGTGARLPLVGIDQLDPLQRATCLTLIQQAERIKNFPHMEGV